jgi:hypothetical protein
VGEMGDGEMGDLSGARGDLSESCGLADGVLVEMERESLGFMDLEASISMMLWD